MSEDVKYAEAFEELQKIVADIERGDITVDELAEKVKHAAELINICKHKLTTTEEDVNQILKDLERTSNGDPGLGTTPLDPEAKL